MSEDATGGGGIVILADTESLPEAAAHWRELLPKYPQQPSFWPDTIGAAGTDPATMALSSAIADWPTIHDYRYHWMSDEADIFVTAVDMTSVVLPAADRSGAAKISSSAEPTPV